MKKLAVLLLAIVAVSCTNPFDTSTPTINGNWTLATFQGVSTIIVNAHGTMIVSNGTSYTKSSVLLGVNNSESGSVALKSGSVYTMTPSVGQATDYTLSSDGKTVSGNNVIFGSHSYTK